MGRAIPARAALCQVRAASALRDRFTCPGGGRYHFEALLRHNDAEPYCKFRVWPTGPAGKTPPTDLAVPARPGE